MAVACSRPRTRGLPLRLATRKLFDSGNGDAALQAFRCGQVPRSLAGNCVGTKTALNGQNKPSSASVSSGNQTRTTTEPVKTPRYQDQEIAQRLSQAGVFPPLVQAVEQVLGKRLTTPDVGILLGLYDA